MTDATEVGKRRKKEKKAQTQPEKSLKKLLFLLAAASFCGSLYKSDRRILTQTKIPAKIFNLLRFCNKCWPGQV